MTFPGGCPRCGGPRNWTFDDDDQVWVRCQDETCLGMQLVLPGFEDEPDCSLMMASVEPDGSPGVVPCEGDAADTGQEGTREPPAGWLSSLWEGGCDGEATG